MPSQMEIQTGLDVKKELSTKLCWAVGSTLHVSYGKRTRLRKWADDLAERLYDRRFEGIDYQNGARPKKG